MFTRQKHALTQGKGGCMALSPEVQDNLQAWQSLVSDIFARPTNLCDIKPLPPTWGKANSVSDIGMGGAWTDTERNVLSSAHPFSRKHNAYLYPIFHQP